LVTNQAIARKLGVSSRSGIRVFMRAEVGGQRSEVGGQRSEVRGQRAVCR
jgi:hypothetical protein